MPKKLAIVESPTKAKTISRFLGKDWDVQSCFGHIRDLPKSDLGIDLDNNYEPHYVIPVKARKTVNNLKKLINKQTEVYLATDEDREGEAIAWHLIQALKLNPNQTKRIAFHEITASAIKAAIKQPRDINENLVNAQQARRVLDRLVGYKLSPWLWKKVAKGLSAGRVQSVAVRLIVAREKEIQAFNPQEYWIINGLFKKNNDTINSHLTHINNQRLDKFYIKNKEQADKLLNDLKQQNYQVADVVSREEKKNPPTPLTTSLLQQEANRKLGFSSKQTMLLAQQLYEGVKLGSGRAEGLITYMRTDSQSLSDKFISEARDYIKNEFGDKYLPTKPNIYKTKTKNAQEAHEAIRPTDPKNEPKTIKPYLNNNQYRLYKAIWDRSIATQMKQAKINVTTISINDKEGKYIFTASGSIIVFAGYLKIYSNFQGENLLPECKSGDKLKTEEISAKQSFTKPPARYSDASLVKELEKKGIGRPSTYAPIISTIISRNYVEREQKRLKPTEIGTIVTELLLKHFEKIMDYNFTAEMEEDLDKISLGKKEWQPIIDKFYRPFEENLNKKYEEVKKSSLVEETDEICEKCGSPMVIKLAKYGKFLACSNFPTCKNTKNLNGDNESEPEELNEKCPDCKAKLQIKHGRYGKFIACSNYPDCKHTKQITEKTDVTCPQCDKGQIISKRTKRGRTFYACDQYPDCQFALWQKPTGAKCPDCNSLLIASSKNTIYCSNKDCGYKKP